jgi:hypothetical protein
MDITIKVLVRIAPHTISQCFSGSSNDQQAKAAVEDAKRVSIFSNGGNGLHTTNPKENIRDKEKDYTFDKIFDEAATQEQVMDFNLFVTNIFFLCSLLHRSILRCPSKHWKYWKDIM